MASSNSYKEVLEEFVIEQLYPLLSDRVGEFFPEMRFRRVGKKWISPYKLDGTEPKDRSKKDKTFVYIYPDRNGKNRAIEQGGNSEGISLIDLYMNLNNLQYKEAVEALSRGLGLEMPKPEKSQYWEAKVEKRKALEDSYRRQRAALYSGTDGANKALQYLKEVRGYSDEVIKGMEWGYLTKEEFLKVSKLLSIERDKTTDKNRTPEQNQKLDSIFGVGREGGVPNPYYRKYPSLEFCTLEYRDTLGRIIGFKLFPIQTPEEIQRVGKLNKLNTRSLQGVMNKNPFGLYLVHCREDTNVIVVESETDTRHAKALNLNNWIATSGGAITEETAQTLQNKGVETVTLFLDSDPDGARFTKRTIETLSKFGIHTLVAEPIPEEDKDPDKFLTTHSKEELLERITKAETGYHYLYTLYVEEYQRKHAETPTERNTILFLDSICKYIANIPDPIQKASILNEFSGTFGVDIEGMGQAIKDKVASYSSIPLDEKKEDELRAKKNDELRNRSLKKLEIAQTLLEREEIQKASTTLQEATDILSSIEEENKYQTLLEDNTEELWESYKNPQKMFYTRILLQNANAEQKEVYLAFPSGAISLIGAGTNHGKSKVLQSLTLDALEQKGEEGTILYITYEENEQSVNKQFLNAYANMKLTNQTSKFGNLVTISNYLFDGDTKYMGRQNNNEVKADTQRKFFEAERKWKELRKTGRIRIIKPEDNDLQTFLGLVKYACTHIKVRAVIVDYVQELYVDESKGRKTPQRTDELKEIMIRIDLLAQKYDIPIIMAAQLDRKLEDPRELTNDKFAESGWLERKASEIVLMYSNRFHPKDESIFNKLKAEAPYSSLYATERYDTRGKILFKLTKSRFNPVGHTAICKIDGNTGRVEGNLPKDTPTPTNNQTRQLSLDMEPDTPKVVWRSHSQSTEPETPEPFPFKQRDDVPF